MSQVLKGFPMHISALRMSLRSVLGLCLIGMLSACAAVPTDVSGGAMEAKLLESLKPNEGEEPTMSIPARLDLRTIPTTVSSQNKGGTKGIPIIRDIFGVSGTAVNRYPLKDICDEAFTWALTSTFEPVDNRPSPFADDHVTVHIMWKKSQIENTSKKITAYLDAQCELRLPNDDLIETFQIESDTSKATAGSGADPVWVAVVDMAKSLKQEIASPEIRSKIESRISEEWFCEKDGHPRGDVRDKVCSTHSSDDGVKVYRFVSALRLR